MRRIVSGNRNVRIALIISIALLISLAAYLVWAANTASIRYARALTRDEREAHTIVGKEGYEYIFEPNTQILIDRIKPNKRAIIFYILREDYLPPLIRTECSFPDQRICAWVNINILYGHNPRSEIQEMSLYASIIGLISAGGFYFLTKNW